MMAWMGFMLFILLDQEPVTWPVSSQAGDPELLAVQVKHGRWRRWPRARDAILAFNVLAQLQHGGSVADKLFAPRVPGHRAADALKDGAGFRHDSPAGWRDRLREDRWGRLQLPPVADAGQSSTTHRVLGQT